VLRLEPRGTSCSSPAPGRRTSTQGQQQQVQQQHERSTRAPGRRLRQRLSHPKWTSGSSQPSFIRSVKIFHQDTNSRELVRCHASLTNSRELVRCHASLTHRHQKYIQRATRHAKNWVTLNCADTMICAIGEKGRKGFGASDAIKNDNKQFIQYNTKHNN
jgi:hypothetical protein